MIQITPHILLKYNTHKRSGHKRKRALEYHSDFDNASQYIHNNSDSDQSIDISYKLPIPQRQSQNIRETISTGDEIYLVFQEYYQKYVQCKPIIDALNHLMGITDDIQVTELLLYCIELFRFVNEFLLTTEPLLLFVVFTNGTQILFPTGLCITALLLCIKCG